MNFLKITAQIAGATLITLSMAEAASAIGFNLTGNASVTGMIDADLDDTGIINRVNSWMITTPPVIEGAGPFLFTNSSSSGKSSVEGTNLRFTQGEHTLDFTGGGVLKFTVFFARASEDGASEDDANEDGAQDLGTVMLTPKSAPEPITLLGSAAALGVGVLLKRKYDKRKFAA